MQFSKIYSEIRLIISKLLIHLTAKLSLKRPSYVNRHQDRVFLIIATGPSAKKYKNELNKFIEKHNPVIMGANNIEGIVVPDYHCFSNRKRFVAFSQMIDSDKSKVLLSPYFPKKFIKKHYTGRFERLMFVNNHDNPFDIDNGIIQASCRTIGVLMMAVALIMGAKRIYVYGLDGYRSVLRHSKSINHYDLNHTALDKAEIKRMLKVENYNSRFLNEISSYMESKSLPPPSIITPTVYLDYYKDISDLI